MKKRPKLEGCNNLQIGVKSILQKINPIKRINEKKKMDNGQPQDINKRQFIKKGLFGVGIGALAALLSKIPFARAVQNINYDNSANAMAVSSDGIIDMPNQSSVGTYHGGAAFTVANGGAVTVYEFETERWDKQNEYDDSTYRFTATKAGIYSVYMQVAVDSITSTRGCASIVRKNGAYILGKYEAPSMAASTVSRKITANGLVELAASDYLEGFFYNDDTVDRNSDPSAYYTWFSIHKVA
jgi:hypothetical protein